MIESPKCKKCGGALVDIDRQPGGRRVPQSVLASCPARVWAQCESCGEREALLASCRWSLKEPPRP
jgi:uncharacterized protein with PIN domain